MITYTSLLFRTLVTALFAFFVFFGGANSASAAIYQVTGWGWGSDDNWTQTFCRHVADPLNPGLDSPVVRPTCTPNGLGWVSFSNSTDQSSFPYGVNIESVTGELSGYAWSSNLGWITFNAPEMQACADPVKNPGDTCPPAPIPKARIALITGPTGIITGGTGNVTGWARMCAVFVSGCSGPIRPDIQTGGWDGWISLSGVGYGLRLNTSMPMTFFGPEPLYSGTLATTTSTCNTCFAYGGNTASSPLDRLAGFGWGMNLGGLSVSLNPASVPASLTFWVDQTTILAGQSTTLRWLALGNITGCNASGAWGPSIKPFGQPQKAEPIGPLAASQTYNLQCFGPAGNTPLRTVTISVNNLSVPMDGACGTADKSVTKSKPTANLCSVGSLLTPPGVVNNVAGNSWDWQCRGVGGANSPLCTASKGRKIPIYVEY